MRSVLFFQNHRNVRLYDVYIDVSMSVCGEMHFTPKPQTCRSHENPQPKKNTNPSHFEASNVHLAVMYMGKDALAIPQRCQAISDQKITRMMVIFTWYSGMDTIIASALTACLCLVFCCCCWWRYCWSWCCVGIGVVHLTSHHPGTQIKCKAMSPILHALLVYGDPNSPAI